MIDCPSFSSTGIFPTESLFPSFTFTSFILQKFSFFPFVLSNGVFLSFLYFHFLYPAETSFPSNCFIQQRLSSLPFHSFPYQANIFFPSPLTVWLLHKPPQQLFYYFSILQWWKPNGCCLKCVAIPMVSQG